MSESSNNSNPNGRYLADAGLIAALSWAAAIILRYVWLMLPQDPESGQTSPALWSVYGALDEPFRLGDAAFPWLAFIGGAFALWLFTLIGRLFLSCFELYLPRQARRYLAFLCGLCIVGIAMEPVAIFFS